MSRKKGKRPPDWQNCNSFSKPVKNPERFDFLIEADGGTTCNVPSVGFGRGYCSFLIQTPTATWVRKMVNLGYGHSNNSAEIMAICTAMEFLINELMGADLNPGDYSLLVRSDSIIALKWSNPACIMNPSASKCEQFPQAIRSVREVNGVWKEVATEWRSRDTSLLLFGH